MKQFFNSTREISAAEFASIWMQGGNRSVGAQFSNMNSWSYLWVEDQSYRLHFDCLEAAIDAQHQLVLDAYDRLLPNKAEIWQKWNELKQAQAEIPLIVDNISTEHQAYHIPVRMPTSFLPEQWTECFIEHYRYGEKSHESVLVARNNGDGTVQLFKLPE